MPDSYNFGRFAVETILIVIGIVCLLRYIVR